MRTPICDELGLEFPIFAFTHCRDVVVAVGKAGGFGTLGAVGFTPEQLEIELTWIDEHIGDHPYGVDIVIPNNYEGMDSRLPPEQLANTLRSMVPQEHLDFARKILADHGVPVEHTAHDSLQLLGWTEATAIPQAEVALRHPKVTMVANALGTHRRT
jgi:NAD(P)H-dependent flavin oxidoreductase YrpB (nitropropane dioxygenase family)